MANLQAAIACSRERSDEGTRMKVSSGALGAPFLERALNAPWELRARRPRWLSKVLLEMSRGIWASPSPVGAPHPPLRVFLLHSRGPVNPSLLPEVAAE